VLALKQLIGRATLGLHGLREQLAADGARAEFLYSYRWAGRVQAGAGRWATD
jgi:hypothetical protein